MFFGALVAFSLYLSLGVATKKKFLWVSLNPNE